MYLHLGENTTILTKNIIGVFDLDNASRTQTTRDFLTKAQKEYRVINVSLELPKAFILCREYGEDIVYISQISSSTIIKRISIGMN